MAISIIKGNHNLIPHIKNNKIKAELINPEINGKKMLQKLNETKNNLRYQIESFLSRQEEINKKTRALQKDIKISYDIDAQIMVAEIFDHETGKKIAQIPIEEMLKILREQNLFTMNLFKI